VILVFGLIVAFGALALRLQGMAFGGPPHRSTASTAPIAAPLGWGLLAGIFPPPPLAAWFQHVAAMLR
jgi:hydrogenase-4 component F